MLVPATKLGERKTWVCTGIVDWWAYAPCYRADGRGIQQELAGSGGCIGTKVPDTKLKAPAGESLRWLAWGSAPMRNDGCDRADEVANPSCYTADEGKEQAWLEA